MATGDELFKKFRTGGFSALAHSEPLVLARHLDQYSAMSDSRDYREISRMLRSVHEFLLSHDEYGGLRVDFVESLDAVAARFFRSRISVNELNDEIEAMLRDYSL